MNATLARAFELCDSPGAPGVDGLTQLRSRRTAVKDAMDAILRVPNAEQRNLLASEGRDFDRAVDRIRGLDERIDELAAQEQRLNASAETTRLAGTHGLQSGYHVGGGETYHPGAQSPSFFRDLLHARSGDLNAADRLRRNNVETGLESRALGNTGGTGGSGGEFAPPAFLLQDWVRLARPGRVTADLFHKEPLPSGVSSVQIPKVASGTTTAPQTTQNTSLSQTDLTTAYLSSSIVTIAGKQVVSQQMVDQSGIPFDKVVMEDIAADYARQLGVQSLIGTGVGGQLRGFLTPASTNVVTWTQAAPTAAGFYGQLAKLQGQIAATRLAPADVIVMAPRRWAWLASYTDSTGRPLVVPTAGGFNSMATPDGAYASGHVGTLLGLDVFVDPSIPVNLGATTSADVVLMFKRDDVWLWESDLRADIQSAPYSDSLALLFRCWNYSAMIPDRYLASLGQLQGSGLNTPVFAA